MALKACKECKKEISSDANPCPLCGKKNPHGMSGLAKFGIGAFLVIFVFPAIVSGLRGGNSSSASSSSTSTAQAAAEPALAVPPMEVDAMQLWRDYDANEVSADNRYKGRALAVSGVVAGIDKDFMGHIIVKLAAPNQFMNTQATMLPSEASAAAGLSKRTQVMVLCKGNGLIVGTPMLSDCVFAR